MDSTGAVKASYEFDPDGNKISAPNTMGVESAKTWIGGHSVNDDTADAGLYLMGHRFYDPSLARFLSRDPIGFAGGLNLYSYGNSPVSTIDPAGLARVLGKAEDFGTFESLIEAVSGIDVKISGGKLLRASNSKISTAYATPASTALVDRLLKSDAQFLVARSGNIPFALSAEDFRKTSLYGQAGDSHLIDAKDFSSAIDDCPGSVSQSDAKKVIYSVFVHELKEAEYEFAKGIAYGPAHAAANKFEAQYLSALKGPSYIGQYGPSDILKGADRALRSGESVGRNYGTLKLQIFPSIGIVGR